MYIGVEAYSTPFQKFHGIWLIVEYIINETFVGQLLWQGVVCRLLFMRYAGSPSEVKFHLRNTYAL